MRKAFTLVEMMVAVSIFSIMVLFLYKSYASLNASNVILGDELNNIEKKQEFQKVIFLDFSLALHNTVKIEVRDTDEDFVALQSSHSLHRRFLPYIAYIVKNGILYRLESLKRFQEYQIGYDHEFDVDLLGEVKNFRVYKSKNKEGESYLIDIDFKEKEDITLKVNVLNQY